MNTLHMPQPCFIFSSASTLGCVTVKLFFMHDNKCLNTDQNFEQDAFVLHVVSYDHDRSYTSLLCTIVELSRVFNKSAGRTSCANT
jgi:hypothetical protein